MTSLTLQGQSPSIRQLIMHSMAEWYMRGEQYDQAKLSRILDVAQDLKVGAGAGKGRACEASGSAPLCLPLSGVTPGALTVASVGTGGRKGASSEVTAVRKRFYLDSPQRHKPETRL